MADMTTPMPGGTEAMDRIRRHLPALSAQLRKVANTILSSDPGDIEHLSASELALRAGTSQATVTRFCQATGFDSYQDLLLTLARDQGRASTAGEAWVTNAEGPEIRHDDPLDKVVAVIASTDVRGLQAAARSLDLSRLDAAARALAGARRIDLYGAGGSGIVAAEAELRLFRIGCHVRAWRDVHEAVTSASLLTPADVAVAFSHSGETREAYEPFEIARSRGATTIAVTHAAESPIAGIADIRLSVTNSPTSYREGGFASGHAYLLLVDCLYVRVSQLTFERSSASLSLTSHVRDRLSLKARPRPLPGNGAR